MDQGILVPIKGEQFVFDHRRAIYWPKEKILIATDLHWGKTQYLRSHGLAISDKIFEEDLRRLSILYEDYDVRTFLVLGDLIHHETALSRAVVSRIKDFRAKHPSELILIKGNHDRYVRFPDSWGIVEEVNLQYMDFFFTHERESNLKIFQFAGHHHPLIRLRAGPDLIRVPAFILDHEHCLLPAFSELTGGQVFKLSQGQKALAIFPEGLELIEK